MCCLICCICEDHFRNAALAGIPATDVITRGLSCIRTLNSVGDQYRVTSVSIIIKALNEAAHIARAIETSLAALQGVDGEVVLADSGSTDSTVEIARRYPIRIVQLNDAADACCGAGPQLGYQHAHGRYICLIDGDMELDPGFLSAAISALDADPRLAGVSGSVEELNLDSLEYVRRTRRTSSDMKPGEVDRLNGGGLFRREAIVSVGHFSDRNLHGHEEFDLAVRLRAGGWRLARLPVRFVGHHGHTTEAYRLLLRRWRTRYLCGSGEVLRASLGTGHLKRTLRGLPEIRLWIAVAGSWAACLLWAAAAPDTGMRIVGVASILLAPVAAMIWRTKSAALGLYSVVAWHLPALGFIIGLLRPRVSPGQPLESRILQDETGERMDGRRVVAPFGPRWVRRDAVATS